MLSTKLSYYAFLGQCPSSYARKVYSYTSTPFTKFTSRKFSSIGGWNDRDSHAALEDGHCLGDRNGNNDPAASAGGVPVVRAGILLVASA